MTKHCTTHGTYELLCHAPTQQHAHNVKAVCAKPLHPKGVGSLRLFYSRLVMCKQMVLAIAFAMLFAVTTRAQQRPDHALLDRMFHYAGSVDTTNIPKYQSFAYKKSLLHIDKKNLILLAIPSMFVVANGGKRDYITETYDEIPPHSIDQNESKRKITLSTIPHFSKTLPTLLKYLTPHIYENTMIGDHLLSPFHQANRLFYKYSVSFLLNGTAKVRFRSKTINTQLVDGEALVDYATGRVLSCKLTGEFDMVNFVLNLEMGKNGVQTLSPTICKLHSQMKILGNRFTNNYEAYFQLPKIISDTIVNKEDAKLMEAVRPTPLSPFEQQLLNTRYRQPARPDSIVPRKVKKPDSKLKKILWDIVGDNLVNRIKSNFGTRNQGSVRISPLLNPLYLDYSERKGVIYKFDARGNYDFNANQQFAMRFKAGYSFKQQQFYFNIPAIFYFNKRRNGYIQMEAGNGNRIRNGMAAEHVRSLYPDSLQATLPKQIDEFKDNYISLKTNFDINNYFSFQIGMVYHRRTAVKKNEYRAVHRTIRYTSMAPQLEIEYRPRGWKGPFISLDYERSFLDLLQSNTGYERWEIDAQYIHRMSRLQSISMRAGAGLYTQKAGETYFLDFANFRENNLPGGWNDDWSGEFELLRSNTYNESNYYIRANATYESPILILSWLPVGGRFLEMERIYFSALNTQRAKFYCELGYGFTTRLFSIGVFASSINGKFERFGCRLGFELFRRW